MKTLLFLLEGSLFGLMGFALLYAIVELYDDLVERRDLRSLNRHHEAFTARRRHPSQINQIGRDPSPTPRKKAS